MKFSHAKAVSRPNFAQLAPCLDYLVSPFHHIPALVDEGLNMVESLTTLDYLEAKYPLPAMLPSNTKDLAIVRMVELATINELLPATTPLFPVMLGFPVGEPEKIEQAKQKVSAVLKFFDSLLDDRPFFGSENITFAEPVAGSSVVSWLPSYPRDDRSALSRAYKA